MNHDRLATIPGKRWTTVSGYAAGVLLPVALMPLLDLGWPFLLILIPAGVLVAALGQSRARAVRLSREARAELNESRERYAVTLRGIRDGVIATDAAGRVTFMNPTAGLLTGWEAGEARGRHLGDLFVALDERTGTPIPDPLARALAGEPEYGVLSPAILVGRDGRRTTIDHGGAPIRDGAGVLTGAVLTFREDTERHASERHRDRLQKEIEGERRRINDIISTMPGVVWEASGAPDSAEQRFEFVSAGVGSLLGYPMSEWLETRGFWLRIVHPDDRERAIGEMRAIYRSGREGVSEFRWIAKDGKEVWVEAHCAVRCDAEGRSVGMQGVTLDVSRRKQVESENAGLYLREQAARIEAESANRSKDDFLATVSHELRSPLNSILGWASALRMGPLDAETSARALETIERNARTQAQLITDILDLSRITGGKVRLSVGLVDLAAVIDEALGSVRLAAEARQVTIVRLVDEEARLVRGDAERLQQVVWNLLSNAIKFTQRGGSVRVVLDRADSQARIRISDTGVGIAADFLPLVFDRFRQAESSSTREHGGLGLGLSIVRHLVELHGGSVEAASAGKGRGAEFTVKLPTPAVRQAAPGPDESPAPVEPGRPGGRPTRLAGIRVLAVDDERDVRELLTTLLQLRGAEVRTASGVRDAWSILKEWRPDVLLSDIQMPGEDGYELIRRIRLEGAPDIRHLPAVALTAYARPEDRARALAAGFRRHLAKPVEPEELTRVIEEVAGLEDPLRPRVRAS